MILKFILKSGSDQERTLNDFRTKLHTETFFFSIKFNFSFGKKKIKTDSDEQLDVTVTAGRVAEWSVTC